MQETATKRTSCDACRLRKIRCSRTTSTDDLPSCQACSRVSEICTFRLPVKRRGPKPKSFSRFQLPIAEAHASQTNPSPSSYQDVGIPQSQVDSSGSQTRGVHDLCSPNVIQKAMQDYLDRLYVLVPIIHRPTFITDLDRSRQDHDPVFRALICCMCALVVATMPHKCAEYRHLDPSFSYSTSEEVVQAVKALVQRLQAPDYYNSLTLEKWAVAYSLGLAMVQLGFLVEGQKFHAEANMITMELHMNRAASYHSLNYIEAQLRKKAFWMNLSSQSHLRLHRLTWDSLSDRFAFEGCDAAQLFPLELDDEDIDPGELHPRAVRGTPLIAGFIASLRIHTCLSSVIEESLPTLMTWCESEHLHKRVVGSCQCGRRISPVSGIEMLEYRLHKLRDLLNNLPPELCLPQQKVADDSKVDSDGSSSRHPQYESMAANINITNIWAQSILLESIIALSDSSPATSPDAAEKKAHEHWKRREEISRQLLNAISKLPEASIESSGLILIFKIRQVAATLMEYPFGEDTQVSFLAEMYSKAFAKRLEELFAFNKRPRQIAGMNEMLRYREVADAASPL